VISSSHRPLPDNTQQSQQTNIHALGRIRTHNLSRRAAADLRGHWNRHAFSSLLKHINPKTLLKEEDLVLFAQNVSAFAWTELEGKHEAEGQCCYLRPTQKPFVAGFIRRLWRLAYMNTQQQYSCYSVRTLFRELINMNLTNYVTSP